MVFGQLLVTGLTVLLPVASVLKSRLEAATSQNPSMEVSPAKGAPITLYLVQFPHVQASFI
jgi:hypothetical protein